MIERRIRADPLRRVSPGLSIWGSDAGREFEPACAGEAGPMDAAFQRRFHGADLEACAGPGCGRILVPGRRTVASALRVMGLEQVAQFRNYHRVLNRNIWSGRWLSRRLFRLLVDAFVSDDDPVVIGLDDTIERRWGARIKARGIYRDPVRSSHGHFVKASGLRWLSLMLLPEIPWAGRCWALPFLTVLAPSERYWQEHKPGQRQYKKLTDWGRQVLIQAALWLAAPAHHRRRRRQLRRNRSAQ